MEGATTPAVSGSGQAGETKPDTTQANPVSEPTKINEKVSLSNDALKISVILPTTAYFMSGLRDFTMNIVRNMTGFSEQWAFRFQSVIDELMNNAIEFGSSPDEEIKVTFISTKGKSIEILVKDTGSGPNKKTAQEMSSYVEEHKNIDPTKITSIRGRGLSQIVANWTDVLEFTDNKDGGLTVHVVKFLEGGEQL